MTAEGFRLPTTVLSGFLGSGKTTLLNNLLNARGEMRVAIIVNDMSEINIDADLVRSGGADLSQTNEELVEMTNGCICCTLRDDLLIEVRRLAEQGRFDYLLIESTGVSEPLPVAATFEFCDTDRVTLSDIARLDAMVTVVDAVNLVSDFDSHDFLRQRGEVRDEEDQRTIVELLVDQIEFADIVVLNKIAAAGPEKVTEARRIIRGLNPDARLLEADYGAVAPEDILGTHLFDPARAQSHPMWFKELFNYTDHKPEDEEYGISSFCYRSRLPFNQAAVTKILTSNIQGVLRAKGHFWVSSDPASAFDYSLAGNLTTIKKTGRWWAATPRANWPSDQRVVATIAHYWKPPFGDRRQELVFIGTADMDRNAISAALDECVVSNYPVSGVPISGRPINSIPHGAARSRSRLPI